MTMPVINVHCHPHGENEIEEKWELWHDLGYVHVCASGDNEIVEHWMERHPDFVTGLWRVDFERGSDQLDEAHDRGFRGLKMINSPLPYAHPSYFPLYARAQELDMPGLFHTGILAIKPSRQENFRPIYLATIAGDFPEWKMIGAHFGLQWYWEAIMTSRHSENVYFDLSGGCWRAFPADFFRHWFERVDRNQTQQAPHMDWSLARRFTFGSDNPDDTIEFYRNWMAALDVPQDVQELIYYKNAAAIFGIDVPPSPEQ